MSDIHWEGKTFQQLTADQVFDILHLRVEVFVVEQQCAYPELDEYDRHPGTIHLSGRSQVGQLLAYARILPPGLYYPEATIGRFVVRQDFRNQGIGHQLLQKTLEEIDRWWPRTPIKMSAQGYLHTFYAQYGFLQVSDGYLEDGIPHVEMLRQSG